MMRCRPGAAEPLYLVEGIEYLYGTWLCTHRPVVVVATRDRCEALKRAEQLRRLGWAQVAVVEWGEPNG